MSRHPAEIIQRKRDGAELSREEIQEFVAGVIAGSAEKSAPDGDLGGEYGGVAAGSRGFGDAQLGAFLMAVCCRGMSVAEVADLTLAMRDSGIVVDLSAVPGIKVDKHSTGGVGDKVSLVLAPLVAAAGVPVPMISGRGLGHTGGTLDKLLAIPGYRTDLSTQEFVDVLTSTGFVMSGPSADLAPADRRMYAIRDVSGTVESIPLITSSILSKKLASGLDALVMDVKVGRAAFMKTRPEAQALMDSLVRVGNQAGKRVRALMTDMDTPLGNCIGNALEVRESIAALSGAGPADLLEIVFALGGEMLVLGGLAESTEAGEAHLAELVASGAALRRLEKNIAAQGGDPRVLEDDSLLPMAPFVSQVVTADTGFVADIDPLAIGRAVVDLGGGRRQPADEIDLRVGVVLKKKLGDAVAAGEPWAEIHAASEAAAELALGRLQSAMRTSRDAPVPGPRILARDG